MREMRMPNRYLPEQPDRHIPARRDRRLFLGAGRSLLLCSALVVVSAVENPAVNAAHAFLGFLLWILGVSLLALLPVAGRLAPALLVGVALLPDFILKCIVIVYRRFGAARSPHPFPPRPSPAALPQRRPLATLLCGALAVVSTVGDPAVNAAHALLGFLLWILRVSLLALLPSAELGVRSRKLESRFLDYGRVLLLGGAVIVISAVGNPASDGVQGVFGLLLVISAGSASNQRSSKRPRSVPVPIARAPYAAGEDKEPEGDDEDEQNYDVEKGPTRLAWTEDDNMRLVCFHVIAIYETIIN
ncbi:hypothetical protein ABZP36_020716 [Zizania latifolia]